jgi:predicted NBD/HSP70 family sugar kinase
MFRLGEAPQSAGPAFRGMQVPTRKRLLDLLLAGRFDARRHGFTSAQIKGIERDYPDLITVEHGRAAASRTRGPAPKTAHISFGRDSGLIVVVQVMRESIRGVIFDAHQRIVAREERPLRHWPRHGDRLSRAQMNQRLRALVKALRQELPRVPGPVVGAVTVWPGAISPTTKNPHRRLELDPRSGPLENTFLPKAVAELFGDAVESTMLSEWDAEAFGEQRHGVAVGYDRVLGVKISGSIGAGLVTQGELRLGVNKPLGDLGHCPVNPERKGPRRKETGRSVRRAVSMTAAQVDCSCGDDSDHLERFASTRAIVERCYEPDDRRNYDELIEDLAANAGERGARKSLSEAGHLIGNILRPVVLMVAPDLIVVRSLPADDRIRAAIVSELEAVDFPPAAVVGGTGGDDGELIGVRGAAAFAREEWMLPRIRRAILGESAA